MGPRGHTAYVRDWLDPKDGRITWLQLELRDSAAYGRGVEECDVGGCEEGHLRTGHITMCFSNE